MRKADIEAIGEVAAEALAAGGTLVSDMHEGIAGRPFRILGPMAAPVRIAHDGISRAVHAGVRTALRALPQGGAHALALRAGDEAPPVGTRTPGALVVAALNGVYGNHLATRGNALALDMEVRRHGAPVPITPDGLAAAFPDATSRIVVFVHGLCETDEAWRLLPLRGAGPDRRPYGERLQDELGFTPIPLRYNTGLHISENGRGLARTLEALVLGWPAPVSELVLVGHSMGGLVARSACHYGEAGDHRWTAAVRHVFCLGSPHLGADLEKGANVLAWGLARLPETRGLARVLNARSVGIKDLRRGTLVEGDWAEQDLDARAPGRHTHVPLHDGARHFVVLATLSRDPAGRVADLLGDLLVPPRSASGDTGDDDRLAFPPDHVHRLGGMNHLDLLNHPRVYEQIRRWLVTRPEGPRPDADAHVQKIDDEGHGTIRAGMDGWRRNGCCRSSAER